MYRAKRIIILAGIAALLLVQVPSREVTAYWVWTPETKKFINPKYAVKDSPKEQFNWAMSFFEAKDYQRASIEFKKLTRQYEYSSYASKSQYYMGLSYEMMGKFYTAFLNYQKAIDNYPHIEDLEAIIAKELEIADIYMTKSNPKIFGADIMTSYDRSAEIYRKVVDNAPFGRLADEAQFKLGESLKRLESYEEAIEAFQKLVENYPESRYIDKARFEVADCATRASLKPAYASEQTERAIRIYEDFTETAGDAELTKRAAVIIRRLKNKASEKSFSTAEFYEKQKHYDSAIIYYKDILERYPNSSYAEKAQDKITALSERKAAKKKRATIAVKKVTAKPEKKPGEKKSWLSMIGLGKKSALKASPVVKAVVEAPEAAAPGAEELIQPSAEDIAIEEIRTQAIEAPDPALKAKASNLIVVNSFFKMSKGWVPFKFAKTLTAPNEVTLADSNPNYAGGGD